MCKFQKTRTQISRQPISRMNRIQVADNRNIIPGKPAVRLCRFDPPGQNRPDKRPHNDIVKNIKKDILRREFPVIQAHQVAHNR